MLSCVVWFVCCTGLIFYFVLVGTVGVVLGWCDSCCISGVFVIRWIGSVRLLVEEQVITISRLL